MIYVTREFSTFGKEFPSMGPTRFQKIPGKAGAFARAVEFGYRYINRHRNIITAGGTIVAGAGITGIGRDINEGTNSFPKALRAVHAVHNFKRKRNRPCHCTGRRYTKRKYRKRSY